MTPDTQDEAVQQLARAYYQRQKPTRWPDWEQVDPRDREDTLGIAAALIAECSALDHRGCKAAVEHAARHFHGPDYPHCAASWQGADETPASKGIPIAPPTAPHNPPRPPNYRPYA